MRILILLCLISTNVYAKGNRLSLLAYNVENLFDTRHDKDKDDWTFLPKSIKGKEQACQGIKHKHYQKECFQTNWTDKKLQLKLSQIQKVIESANKETDIIALSEVENENVVSMLAKKLGRKNVIVTNSPDKRGIDLAIIYSDGDKLKKVAVKEHEVTGDYFKSKPTRNILEVEFLLNGKEKLNVFVNHWPSQGNPSVARIAAAETLKKRVEEILKEDPKRNIIVTGDFNTISRDNPHPFNDVIFKDNLLTDVHAIAKDVSISGVGSEGTYFYYRGKVWNQLDRIMINKNLLDRKDMELDVSSYRIHAKDFMSTQKKIDHDLFTIPKSYDFKAEKAEDAGFSDHYPVYAEFTY